MKNCECVKISTIATFSYILVCGIAEPASDIQKELELSPAFLCVCLACTLQLTTCETERQRDVSFLHIFLRISDSYKQQFKYQ